MAIYPEPIKRLIECLNRLPGIGRRSAERIVGYVLNASEQEVLALLNSMHQVKKSIRLCRVCRNFSEADICAICRNDKRDRTLLCVVENPQDVMALEKSGSFKGVYHVLGGVISPLENKVDKELQVKSLLARVKRTPVKEIILAMDADAEGEATALYLTSLLKPSRIKLTRIGVGIPSGANVEYVDSTTLASALASRRAI